MGPQHLSSIERLNVLCHLFRVSFKKISNVVYLYTSAIDASHNGESMLVQHAVVRQVSM